ncbi:hypothetical protein ACFYPC_09640 [Streptomyces sp. NPDC005808]|uniref:hypothetical protein n=1 Tax=Streptomyces sp. NPDC005808 TaxID=3364734 RepID=UPI003683B1C1
MSSPTSVTVDTAGRVAGHLAVFGRCHHGLRHGAEDLCLMAPRSPHGFPYFNARQVITTGGMVRAGVITLDTSENPDPAQALARMVSHWDNTNTQAAAVCAGQDEHGVWVAGALLPDLDRDRCARMELARFAGIWQQHDGRMELAGAMALDGRATVAARLVNPLNLSRTLVAAGALPAPAATGRVLSAAALALRTRQARAHARVERARARVKAATPTAR